MHRYRVTGRAFGIGDGLYIDTLFAHISNFGSITGHELATGIASGIIGSGLIFDIQNFGFILSIKYASVILYGSTGNSVLSHL